MKVHRTIDLLVRAAHLGGDRALELQKELMGKPVIEMDRYRGDFKTKADDESQDLILAELQRHDPDIPIIAEEMDNPQVRASTYRTVDPLDGTWGYAFGSKEWGVNIGDVEEGVLRRAVLYFPALGITVTAEKSKGCYINGERVLLHHDKPLRESILGLITNSAVDRRVHEEVSTPLIYEALNHRNIASCAGGTLEVLQGRAHTFMNWHGFIWDYVGALAVEEAGGVALAFDGSPLRWDNVKMGVLFAANKELAAEVVEYSGKAAKYQR